MLTPMIAAAIYKNSKNPIDKMAIKNKTHNILPKGICVKKLNPSQKLRSEIKINIYLTEYFYIMEGTSKLKIFLDDFMRREEGRNYFVKHIEYRINCVQGSDSNIDSYEKLADFLKPYRYEIFLFKGD